VENQSQINTRPFLLQSSSYQVWAQAIARLLYQAGHGTIHFFLPLIFVNQLGFSATVVGLGISIGALAGVIGHVLGGYLTDAPKYGRKQTLLFSAGLSAFAAILLGLLPNLPMLIVANLIMGLGAGCYWTAADASVIDITPQEKRQQAFAVLGLANSLGSGLGVLGGGILLSLVAQAQTLFLISGFVLLVFLILIQFVVTETRQNALEHSDTLQGFGLAFKDRALQLFVLISVLFTTYIALIHSTLPLYLTNFITASASQTTPTGESSLISVANLFTWCYIGIGAVLQLPLVHILTSLLNIQALMISMLLWGSGFFLVWATHLIPSFPILFMIAAFSVFAIASDIFRPFSAAVIAELAPESLRGVYLAISHQCWSIGYFVGPILGGWAMDQSPMIAHYLWIATAASTISGLVILHFLRQHQDSNRTALI
jgi:MFS family permease